MGNEWLSLVGSMVVTKIKNQFSEVILNNYKMDRTANFSTVGSNNTPAVFPFVYIQMLPAVEQARDLEGNTVNAGLFTFQIDVTDNQYQQNANTVAFEILRIMKGMGFEISAMPSFEDTNGIHRCTARYKRMLSEESNL